MGHVVIIVGSHHNAPRIIHAQPQTYTGQQVWWYLCAWRYVCEAGWLAGWPHRHLQTCTVSYAVVVAGNAAAVWMRARAVLNRTHTHKCGSRTRYHNGTMRTRVWCGGRPPLFSYTSALSICAQC